MKNVDELTVDLRNPNKNVRREAVFELSMIGDARAVELLIQVAHDPNEDVRKCAVRALGEIGDPSAIQSLRIAVHDHSNKVRSAAALALAELRDSYAFEPLIATLQAPYEWLRRRAAYALRHLGDQRASDTLHILWRGDPELGVRIAAADALGQLGNQDAIEWLISSFDHQGIGVRRDVVIALGQIQEPRIVEFLITAYQDQSAEVREKAILALRGSSDPRAANVLLVALYDPSMDIRESARDALLQLGAATIDAIALAAPNAPKTTRKYIAEILGEIGDARAIETLANLLHDPVIEVRKEAMDAVTDQALVKQSRIGHFRDGVPNAFECTLTEC